MRLFIPIKPKPAPRPRFSRKGTYNPSDYTEYKKVITLAFMAKYGSIKSTYPISMKLDFFFKIPKSWNKQKKADACWHTSRPDADNLTKSIKDSLNGVAYVDDSQVCMLLVRKQYATEDGILIELIELK